MSRTDVAVVCAVLNERKSIDALLESLLGQTRPPNRIVVVDGGSHDGTQEAVRRYQRRGPPVELIELPGSNISQARNAGIARVAAPIIAVTDAGVRLDPDWLERIVAPLERHGAAPDVVAGFFRPNPQATFETALGATTLIPLEEVDPERFLPSSRSVAFRRDAWAAIGGYPEWLSHSEDVLFDLRLKEHGFRFRFEPRALVHFRPRPTLRAFFRQYYAYARGDGRAGLWPQRHAARYAAFAMAPAIVLGARRRRRFWLVGMVLVGAYLFGPYRRVLPWLERLSVSERVKVLAWVPVIRLVGDLAKMLGYPAGRWVAR